MHVVRGGKAVDEQKVSLPSSNALARSLFTVPIETNEVLELLTQAVDAHLKGDGDTASNLLVAADSPALRAFAIECMISEAKRLQRSTVRDLAFPKIRTGFRMPSQSIQRAIMTRDGHRCRFCETKVIALGVRSALSRAFPGAVPWPEKPDHEKHGAFLALNATIDHLLPHSRGGNNEPDNLVTTCWPCNFAREDLLLHELGIADPRQFAPIVDDWDGLSRLLSRRRAANPRGERTEQLQCRARPPESVGVDWSALQPLLDELSDLRRLGIVCKQGKTLLIQIQTSHGTISPLAASPDGTVEAPWAIGPYKDLYQPFAEALAAAISGGRAYETPKMWRVGKAGGGLSFDDLVHAKTAIRIALIDLAANMAQRSSQ